MATVGRSLSLAVIEGRPRFPRLRVTLVDIASIVQPHRDLIDQMKPLFSKTDSETLLPGDALPFTYSVPGDPRRLRPPFDNLPEELRDVAIATSVDGKVGRH
jgi:hypothetical protein